MFKRLVNECTIDLRIRPEGALLIKSGMPQMSDVDMAWVKVYRNGRSEVYLPGSSLKGTIRSHAERIARTIKSDAACDPFEKEGKGTRKRSCSDALKAKKKEIENKRKAEKEWSIEKKEEQEVELAADFVYKSSCPVCRIFGNTWILGRFAVEDAYVEGDQPETQQRDGVGIDRFTGGAAHGAKFELEVITDGVFKTTLHLQNFELWQLGLLGFVLQDMKDGLVRMGSGKSRGLGKVVAEVGPITLNTIGAAAKAAENGHINIFGVGALFEQAEDYGMVKNDSIQVESGKATLPTTPFSALRQSVQFTYDDFPWQKVVEQWVKFTQGYKDGLESYRRRT